MDRARFDRMLAARADRRRTIMAGAAAFTTVSLAGRPTRTVLAQATPPASPAAFAAGPFTLGVASGDPLPDGVVLWTRLAPDPLVGHGGMEGRGPVEVLWEVGADQGFGTVIQTGAASATPELGHSVHVDVRGWSRGASTSIASSPAASSARSDGRRRRRRWAPRWTGSGLPSRRARTG